MESGTRYSPRFSSLNIPPLNIRWEEAVERKFERWDAKELLILSSPRSHRERAYTCIVASILSFQLSNARHSSLIDENWILGHSV